MSWFVAIAERSRQRQAVEHLGEMSFPAYAPTFLETVVRNGRKTEVSRFLFGRYFFIAMKEGWEAICDVRFVSRVLLGPRLKPLLIRDDVVNEIKMREIDGAIHVDDGLHRGDRVTPRVGPLAGIYGRFHRAERNKDIAKFDILGIETLVNFAPGMLIAEPIESEKKKRRHHKRSVDHVTRREHAA